MAGTRVGVEVDGDRVTVVEVVDDVAVAMRSVDVGDLAESASLALAGFDQPRRGPATRVCLCTSRLTLRRIDVSAQLSDRAAFEDAAFSVMPVERASHAVAGAFFRPDLVSGQAVSPGVALVAPADEVQAAYAAFGKRRVEVVAPCLALRFFNGLWLALRFRATELALVHDDHVVAARQMRAGGLDAVAALLSDGDPVAGIERLEQALAEPGRDIIADAEVDRHLRAVAAEVRQTVDFWSRSGEHVGQQVLVFGPGAQPATVVRAALAEQELESTWPGSLDRSMSYVTPSERPAALGAYLAAMTCGDDLPQSAFVDPRANVAVERSRTRSAKARRVALGGAALLVAGATAGLPAWQAVGQRDQALVEQQQAQQAFDQRAQVAAQLDTLKARAQVVASASAVDPDWGRVASLVLESSPDGAQVTQLTSGVESGSVVVSLTADQVGGTYAELIAWMRALEEKGALTWAPNFSTRESTATYQLTFRLPLDQWAAPRLLPSVPGLDLAQPAVPAAQGAAPVLGQGALL